MLQAMTTMESEIMLWVQEYLRRDWLDPIWIAVTTLGNGGMIWILLSVGLLIPKKTRKTGMLALLALAFSYLINNLLLKNLIARTRPYEVIAGLHTLIGASGIILSRPAIREALLQPRWYCFADCQNA